MCILVDKLPCFSLCKQLTSMQDTPAQHTRALAGTAMTEGSAASNGLAGKQAACRIHMA